MMLPNYAFYFPLFGALDTIFGARHYCVAMSNVMKRMKYVKTAYLSALWLLNQRSLGAEYYFSGS